MASNRDEVRKLGSLGIPAIVKAIDDGVLSVGGLRLALELVVSYEDARVAAVLRRMLEGEDPILQMVAAQFIPRLEGAARQLDKVIPRVGLKGYPAVTSLSHVVTTRFG